MLYQRTTQTIDGHAALDLSGSIYMPMQDIDEFAQCVRFMKNMSYFMNEVEHIMNEGDDDAKGYALMQMRAVEDATITAQMDILTGPPQEVK